MDMRGPDMPVQSSGVAMHISRRTSAMLTLTASGLGVGQVVPERRRRRFAQRVIDLVEEP